MTETKDKMSQTAQVETSEATEKNLYKRAVSNGAFTVSAGGAKRIDIVRFLELDVGRDRLEKIVRDSENLKK